MPDDEKHPSHNETYLVPWIFYNSLSGSSSKGLDRRYEGKYSKSKKIFYNIIEKSVVSKCQEIANEIVFQKWLWIHLNH